MEIRAATTEDIPALMRQGAEFAAFAGTGVDTAKAESMLGELISSNAGCVIVLTDALADVVGGIIGVLSEELWSRRVVAQELVWWVAPEYRRGGVRLLRAFEAWATMSGAADVVVSDLATSDEAVGHLYESRGYTLLERQWVRRVEDIG